MNTAKGRPSNVSADQFIDTAKTAGWYIMTGHTECGISSDIDVKLSYQGTTTATSNIDGANRCASANDNKSVVDFGSLSGTTLAFACTRFRTVSGWKYKEIYEADIRFDNTSRSWVTKTTGCTGEKYDLLSVAVHEFGHFVGLNHAPEEGGSDLTMSPIIEPCNGGARTLGKGDIRGLEIPY